MKKHSFSETVMFRWKQIVLLSLWVIGFSSNALAETTLTIATGELPPITSEQPEKSFLTDVFQAMEKEMGVKFVFKFLSWKRCDMYVENLKVWGAIPYIPTPEREQKFNFSEPIYKSASKFFGYTSDGKMKNFDYTELSQLKSYKIGGVRGYWYERVFHDAGIELELARNNELNIRKLVSGRIDLVLLSETTGWYTIKTMFAREMDKFFASATPFMVKDVCLMTSKQYPDGQKLLTKFNTALEKIKRNGIFQKIADKHGIVLFAY